MQTSDGKRYRIRYGYQKVFVDGHDSFPHYQRRAKNVLVTIQMGDCKTGYVFFGIARCKTSVDNFSKKEGRELALSRALRIFDDCGMPADSLLSGFDSFCLDAQGVKGYCAVKYVKTLLRHFEGLDQK